MSLNVNINPLNFREMRLREPQGARQFGEAIDAWKRGNARRRAERIEDERLATEKAERDFKREQNSRAERIEDERLATEKAERDFKREQNKKLADMLTDDGNIDAQIVDIENKIAELEDQNRELMKGR